LRDFFSSSHYYLLLQHTTLLEGFFSSFHDFALSAAAAAAYHLGFLKDFSRPFNECSIAFIGFEIWSKPMLFLTHR